MDERRACFGVDISAFLVKVFSQRFFSELQKGQIFVVRNTEIAIVNHLRKGIFGIGVHNFQRALF